MDLEALCAASRTACTLAGSLDESAKTGSRTRLLRFQPGVYTTDPFVHEYWEEVYLLNGDLVDWGTIADGDELLIVRYRLFLLAA